MTTNFMKSAIAVALAALLFGLAGCADKSNPDNIDRRAVERWNFLIAHQAEKAYDYLTPGFRATQTREDYAAAMNNRPLQWKSAKFKHKECDADRCLVDIDVSYLLVMPGALNKPIESTGGQNETWIQVDGEWYFLPK
ncbi:MAG: hypothetical protein ABIQ70_06530 [Dokdonella sp.]